MRYQGPGWYSIYFKGDTLTIVYYPEWTDETASDEGDLFQVDREALFWSCVAFKIEDSGRSC